jgi:hypothetical protein
VVVRAFAGSTQYLVDVLVVTSSRSVAGLRNVLPGDVNAGSGGDYVYLCPVYGPNRLQAITGFGFSQNAATTPVQGA